MNNKELVEIAENNLARNLTFFPRTDTVLSVILALNLGLLAVLAVNAPALRLLDWYVLLALFFLILITISFYHLHKCAFPQLDGGYGSLIYFREIANKTQLQYCEKFKEQTEEDYLDDLIEQVWRNSEILMQKFNHLKMAFVFSILSLIFWLPALIIFASKNTERFLVK